MRAAAALTKPGARISLLGSKSPASERARHQQQVPLAGGLEDLLVQAAIKPSLYKTTSCNVTSSAESVCGDTKYLIVYRLKVSILSMPMINHFNFNSGLASTSAAS